jgi:hypothetical protein
VDGTDPLFRKDPIAIDVTAGGDAPEYVETFRSKDSSLTSSNTEAKRDHSEMDNTVGSAEKT